MVVISTTRVGPDGKAGPLGWPVEAVPLGK